MTAPHFQATPRGRQWAPEPRPSRVRPWLGAIAWALVLLAAGIENVNW